MQNLLGTQREYLHNCSPYKRSVIHISARRGPVPELAGSAGPDNGPGAGGSEGPEFATSVDDGGAVAKKQRTKQKPLNVRKEFPETWLWTEEVVK